VRVELRVQFQLEYSAAILKIFSSVADHFRQPTATLSLLVYSHQHWLCFCDHGKLSSVLHPSLSVRKRTFAHMLRVVNGSPGPLSSCFQLQPSCSGAATHARTRTHARTLARTRVYPIVFV